ncbi:MAG: hypothetical protein ACUVXA_06645 [Candidatus Jordarchaeum sp.]|uniref:hypothetical protein n=1 Tax=Candidatus Jordarchaeum sp. TaxID=2823881 RepID=UPI00404AAE54
MSHYQFDEIDEILLNLVCRGACAFYKEDTHEKNWEKYQCGAYLGLKKMLKEKKLTKEQLEKLLKELNK